MRETCLQNAWQSLNWTCSFTFSLPSNYNITLDFYEVIFFHCQLNKMTLISEMSCKKSKPANRCSDADWSHKLFAYYTASIWTLPGLCLLSNVRPWFPPISSPSNIQLCPPTSKTITCLLLCSLNRSIQLILTGSSSISQINWYDSIREPFLSWTFVIKWIICSLIIHYRH